MVILVAMLHGTVKASHRFAVNSYGYDIFDHHISSVAKPSFAGGHYPTSVDIARIRIPSASIFVGLDFMRSDSKFKSRSVAVRGTDGENVGELFDEDDDDLCPVECVKEFKTDEEFIRYLHKAKETKALVVVDFYRTSCGSCKYIEQGFSKICKGSGEEDAPIIFLKHNVMDEYDEQSETAERLRIKTVPLFHFYKDGVLLESFPTRDKERINEAIHLKGYLNSVTR